MELGFFLIVPFSLLICYFLKKLWLISHNHNQNGESRVNFPPGSRGLLPYIGETLHFVAAIYSKHGFYSFVQARHLRYGNCFKTHIFGETHVFVSSTESAKEILSNDLGKFTKKYIRSIGEVIGSESLLCASHKSHKLIRRHLLDLFTSRSNADFTKQFDELVVKSLSKWEYKENVVILDEALKMSCKAMCKMLLSLEDENEVYMLQNDVSCVCQGMLAFPLKFPWTAFSKGLQARNRIMKMLEKMIQERRARRHSTVIHDSKDFLQCLVVGRECQPSSSSDTEPTLTDAQIKDNILTMIIAGQDTTGSAMSWMVKYLDDNQEVLKALQDEIHSLEKRVTDKSFLTLEDLNEMIYAAKVVKESLRMASIVPWFPRIALHDCNILGYTIKKGWNINVDARSIHCDPTLYRNPHKFDPSRFDNEAKAYSYLAFGVGGRTCLGTNLARIMMLVFLYRLLTAYKWEVTDPDSSVESWALFSRLKTGCPIRITQVYNQTN
ncbi:abscisic acid 8'-hydroxylase 4 isoform X2 [Spinacia oleracea]|uniref:Abscisic acid 8'-hydroxylase 4 isoform X2 n=1 Tax=Spinacia oleracea TaxID=3562 RepID=A0A9R0IQL9_SPIOL|nr:abscisic acid 8'-hydroxylase 4 isoform X2 [Spinacia oleracea]